MGDWERASTKKKREGGNVEKIPAVFVTGTKPKKLPVFDGGGQKSTGFWNYQKKAPAQKQKKSPPE